MMIITRFAPSPTGFLHLGHAYSALLASKLALSNNGKFCLRIEDIDKIRCKRKFEEAVFEDLAWLDISWESEVFRQSERTHIYLNAIEKLKSLDMLYPCFCTRKVITQEIQNIGQAPHYISSSFKNKLYPGTCKRLKKNERDLKIKNGENFALRLNMEKAIQYSGPLFWHDLNNGIQKAQPQKFGDVIIARKDIQTSYHLAVTIDDHAQSINTVTRGLDLFDTTHIHRLLQCLLDFKTPEYLHHKLLTDAQGNRLSKRNQSSTLRSMRKKGISKEQILALIEPTEKGLYTS